MITVKVVDKSTGKSAKDRKVALQFWDGVTDIEYTDENGEAHFDFENRNGKVHVDGSIKHEGHLSDRIVIYI